MNDEIELRHLRYFLAVAETLHFTRAAERLGMAQPPLSQQIRKLETLLGHPLFARTTRGVKLTPAGELLAERARTTLARIEDDLEQVRRIGRGDEGTLTVGFSGSVIFTELPTAIRRFRRKYPRVELRLLEMWTAQQTRALREGALDLGFMRDGDVTEGLEIATLLKERYLAVLPEAHPLAKRKVLRAVDLRSEPFVLFARSMGPLAYDRTMAVFEHSGFQPRIVQQAPQFPTLFRLVAAGIGVSLAPACMAKLAIPGVVYREVQSTARTTVDLGMRIGFRSALAENFMGLVRGVLRG